MRRFTLASVLSITVLIPTMGTAQVFVQPTAYPRATAATAIWQQRGDAVFHAGGFYYPVGPTIFFDGNVMNRTGTYEGIALYEDATQLPFTVVYVPIGGNVVRPYERRREGELAGTTGSRTPSFPIQRDGELSVAAGMGMTGIISPSRNEGDILVIPESFEPAATLGTFAVPRPPLPAPVAAPTTTRVQQRGRVPSIFQVWLPYQGQRWYSAGAAVPYAADRFVQIGEYRGFPVYRSATAGGGLIYVTSVDGGPVAPYRRTP